MYHWLTLTPQKLDEVVPQTFYKQEMTEVQRSFNDSNRIREESEESCPSEFLIK